MEKAGERGSVSQATAENGLENPGLELMERGNPEESRKTEETEEHSRKDGPG